MAKINVSFLPDRQKRVDTHLDYLVELLYIAVLEKNNGI